MLVLRVLGIAVIAVLLLFAATIGVLRLTNPKMRDVARWDRRAEMPHARGEVASAGLGTKLVVAGGLHGIGRTADRVDVYDISRNEWTRGRSLPAPRHHSAASAAGEHVYLSGGAPGARDWTPTNNLWRARPGDPWKAMRPMPAGRHGHAMVTIGERLYVVGGAGYTLDTLIYDIEDDRWTKGAPIPLPRHHLRAVAWNGKVWAIGGRRGSPVTNVDVYDPETDTWAPGPSLPSPMSAMSVGVLRDVLHVVGGEDPRVLDGGVLDRHYSLAEGAKEWKKAHRAMLPVHGAGFAVYKDVLIVTGGASRQGLLSTISWTPVTQMYRTRAAVSKLVQSVGARPRELA